jgi:hypothetical protein
MTMLSALFKGLVRGYSVPFYGDRDEEEASLSPRGEVLTALGSPGLAEVTRLGDSWAVITSSAQAALTALPTTTAGLSIYNNEPADGKIYAIDSVHAVEIVVDATQQNQLALFAMSNIAGAIAAPTGTLTPVSLSGKGAYSGKAAIRAAASVNNNTWLPIGNSQSGAATVAGGAWRVTEVNIDGRYIVIPGGQFSVAAAKIAATASQVHFAIRWHEVRTRYNAS